MAYGTDSVSPDSRVARSGAHSASRQLANHAEELVVRGSRPSALDDRRRQKRSKLGSQLRLIRGDEVIGDPCQREEEQAHQIEAVGSELRKMMPFLDAVDLKEDA